MSGHRRRQRGKTGLHCRVQARDQTSAQLKIQDRGKNVREHFILFKCILTYFNILFKDILYLYVLLLFNDTVLYSKLHRFVDMGMALTMEQAVLVQRWVLESSWDASYIKWRGDIEVSTSLAPVLLRCMIHSGSR